MMDESRILEELIRLLEHHAIPVKQDRGNFKGGLIRYHDEQVFYLNRKAETSTKINLILEELKYIDFSEEALSEGLRNYLEGRGLLSGKNSLQVN
jgi:hypothetical protein